MLTVFLILAFMAGMAFGGDPTSDHTERKSECTYHASASTHEHDPWIDLGGES